MAEAHLNADQFENIAGVRASIRRAQAMFMPPPNIKPSDWAQSGAIRIPEGNAKPGPYRLANAPYQRDPMDQLVNPDCYRVTLMWGAQIGKTLTALAVQAYCIEMRPRSQMMMQPSNGDLTTWLETKWNPLVDANKTLQRLIAKPRGREGVNNQKMKSYPGGFMMFAWSGSPKTMRGRSAPLIVCDEVDGYAVTEEGHPVGLLWQRAATFGDDRMLVEISTPTIKGESYIEASFEAGDKRRFHIICPECGHHQTLKWENVHWNGRRSHGIDDADLDTGHDDHEPASARYACEGCGVLLDDGQRVAAIRTAEENGAGWKAEKPFKGHASYHANELYSTFRRLRDIVQSYLDKLATDDLQTFVNVSLSLTWEEKGEKADPDSLQERAKHEVWAAPVPMGGLYLTAGIDMQMDRLEVEVVAWGEAEESWSVGYYVLWGDPLQADVWQDLDDLLAEEFLHEVGVHLPISAACLDTGGTSGMTQAAYDWLRGKTGRRMFGVKGQAGWGMPIVQAPQRKQSGRKARKVDLFIVGTDEAKLVVMRRLAKSQPGPGYVHVPATREAEWFKQITAEKMVTRYVKGQPIREWHKPDKARNEALDCRVYAYAALKISPPSFKKLAERIKQLAEAARPAEQARPVLERKPAPAPRQEIPQEEAPAPQPQNRPVLRQKRTLKPSGKRGTFATKW